MFVIWQLRLSSEGMLRDHVTSFPAMTVVFFISMGTDKEISY